MAFVWCLSCLNAYSADIASVNFDAIKADLREYYFSKPENAEAKKDFEASVQEEKNYMEQIEKRVMEGNKTLDLTKMTPPGMSRSRYAVERQLNVELKKELYQLVSGLGLKYDLIYDSSNTDAIIFAKSQVDDVTTTVRQALLDLAKKR